jgi:hypothetical protein
MVGTTECAESTAASSANSVVQLLAQLGVVTFADEQPTQSLDLPRMVGLCSIDRPELLEVPPWRC